MSEDSESINEIESCQKELDENPSSITALSMLAQHYAGIGEYDNSAQHYERIVQIDEHNGKAWTALGHCYLLQNEYQKCFTAYQRALYSMEDNKDAQLWYGIGLLYYKFESYKHAEPAFLAVLKIEPDFEQKGEVLFKLGTIYKFMGMFENAITYLRNSIAADNVPNLRKIEALCNIGQSYEKMKNIDKAISIYQDAVNIDPKNFKPLEYLGWAYYLKEDYSKAEETFRTAISNLNDSCVEASDLNYLLGKTYMEMGPEKYSDSQLALQKAIYKNPNSYLFWVSIGILYAKATQPQDAFECLVKATNIKADKAETWFNLGILYEACKQKREAILAYQRANNIDPNLKAAERRRKYLEGNQEIIEDLPEYIHPSFEISDKPFSISKPPKSPKGLTDLPSLYKLNSLQDIQAPSSDSSCPSASLLPSIMTNPSPSSNLSSLISNKSQPQSLTRVFTAQEDHSQNANKEPLLYEAPSLKNIQKIPKLEPNVPNLHKFAAPTPITMELPAGVPLPVSKQIFRPTTYMQSSSLYPKPGTDSISKTNATISSSYMNTPSGAPTSSIASGMSNLPSSMPPSIPQSIPSGIPSSLSQSIPSNLSQSIPSNLSQSIPSHLSQSIPSNLSQSIPSSLSQSIPSSISNISQSMPNMPNIPYMPSMPNIQDTPSYPNPSSFPNIPTGVSDLQNIPNPPVSGSTSNPYMSMQGLQGIPNMQGISPWMYNPYMQQMMASMLNKMMMSSYDPYIQMMLQMKYMQSRQMQTPQPPQPPQAPEPSRAVNEESVAETLAGLGFSSDSRTKRPGEKLKEEKRKKRKK
jgi:tetratricopeptide (TPR) repeat protein